MKLLGRVVKTDENWVHIELIGKPHNISLPASDEKFVVGERVQIELVSKPAKCGATIEIKTE